MEQVVFLFRIRERARGVELLPLFNGGHPNHDDVR